MSELNEDGTSPARNPLVWISLVVIGLIIFVFLSGDRDLSLSGSNSGETREASTEIRETASTAIASVEATTAIEGDGAAGAIERSLLVPPGMRAREYIKDLREQGKPYPFAQVYENAQKYMQEGSLADAHLLYFFAAREDHVPSIMKLAEMADPTLFRAEDALMDDADVIQAYKWYRKAADMGHQLASERVDGLQQWASSAAEDGNPLAKQLLLNFR
jgi:TPR repeat protein